MITASLQNHRQSPRKVRLVANLVRGKSAVQALDALEYVDKKAASPLAGLLKSAISNAKNNFNLDKEILMIKEFRVDVGPTMKRRMPRARGNAYPINKRTSHISIVLAPISTEKSYIESKKVGKSLEKNDKSDKKNK